jgi:hypothetical protein
MSELETSAKIASKAGEIMATARKGGPIMSRKDEIIRLLHASTDSDVVESFDALLRPYIDNAESVAASALVQREGS